MTKTIIELFSCLFSPVCVLQIVIFPLTMAGECAEHISWSSDGLYIVYIIATEFTELTSPFGVLIVAITTILRERERALIQFR